MLKMEKEKEKGTYIHMWWTSEIRKKEWALIFKEIRKIIGCDIQISPIIALLNITKNNRLKKYQKGGADKY